MAHWITDKDGKLVKVAGNYGGSLKNIKRTLLWTNPNQTIEFSSQTITLSSDDYNFLIINLSRNNSSYKHERINLIVEKNQTTTLSHVISAETSGYFIVNSYRTITYVNDLKYTISNCSYGTLTSFTTRNDLCFPIKIYGVKLGV